MHKEILTDEQVRLLPLVQTFSKQFGLVGGTAIALHIGHRRSVDFDLFSQNEFQNAVIRQAITRQNYTIQNVFADEVGQFAFFINEVQFTFLHYPFPLTFTHILPDVINLPDLLTLAAMKAYALGRRAKWKDYVDLYFIIKDHHSVAEIAARAGTIFGDEFNEKVFRAQLAYFNDVNYSEKITYLTGFAVSDRAIKKQLEEFSL